MCKADVIAMATPLYFFGPSAQLKVIFDRMFSLYKWDNEAGTMQTSLRGKTLVLIASAFEDKGLEALEKPFAMTAEYTGMTFKSLLITNAGVSGDILLPTSNAILKKADEALGSCKKGDVQKQAIALGQEVG
jgi:multimeric flavodoxin WrbA